jgi:hypothetical protein
MNLFENRKLLLATKHGKEEVLKPLLEMALNVNCFISTEFNTDLYGTFSGEIARKEDALSTLRKKCLAAMSYYNCDLAVASEGSFGPHPSAFFSTADDELLIFIDLKNKIEIIGRKLSMETNFASKTCHNMEEFELFLNQVKFPSHKVILKNIGEHSSEIYKDISNREEADCIFEMLSEKNGSAFVETDMRAMNNPTRMNVIKEAAEHLIIKIKSLCPECQFPGFSVTSAVPGLPCSCCNFRTKSILYNEYRCSKCDFSEKKYFPRNLQYEDPMYCDNCYP